VCILADKEDAVSAKDARSNRDPGLRRCFFPS